MASENPAVMSLALLALKSWDSMILGGPFQLGVLCDVALFDAGGWSIS